MCCEQSRKDSQGGVAVGSPLVGGRVHIYDYKPIAGAHQADFDALVMLDESKVLRYMSER